MKLWKFNKRSSTLADMSMNRVLLTELIAKGALVGVIAGFFGASYRYLILESEHIRWHLMDDITMEWAIGWLVVMVIFAFIVDRLLAWAPLSGGSGIPQIEGEMLGLFDMKPYRTLVSKMIGGVLTGFAGFSVGREGPAVQIGGSAGKIVSYWMNSGLREQRILTSAGAGAANGEGNAIELPALRPAEERLARRSGVLKRSSREEGSPSQSAQSAASSPEGGALGSEEKSELDEEAAENQNELEGKDGEEKGEGKTKSPEERRKAFGELLRGEYADLTEELMQTAVTEATRRLEASPAMKGLMQALQEKYGTDANDLVALTEAVRNGAVKDDAYYEKLAMEKGVSTRTARELDKLESQNKHLTEQQQMIQQMERQRVQQARIAELQAGWDREAEQLKAQYPDFNMAEVLANPEVEKMMRSGVSMTNAYRSAYFDHILKQQQAATARQVEQGVVNRMQQRNARPGENGTRPGGAVQTKIDVSHMSRKEMEEMEKRVMRGEVITL